MDANIGCKGTLLFLGLISFTIAAPNPVQLSDNRCILYLLFCGINNTFYNKSSNIIAKNLSSFAMNKLYLFGVALLVSAHPLRAQVQNASSAPDSTVIVVGGLPEAPAAPSAGQGNTVAVDEVVTEHMGVLRGEILSFNEFNGLPMSDDLRLNFLTPSSVCWSSSKRAQE